MVSQRGSRTHRGMLLQGQYEAPILSGAKRWEGRALQAGGSGIASRVHQGDIVRLRLTKDRTKRAARSQERFLSFQVAVVRCFSSCAAMLRDIGLQRLLPGFRGQQKDAVKLYEQYSTSPGSKYVAWKIKCPVVKNGTPPKVQRAKPLADVHWTMGRGMVKRGTAQQLLDGREEELLRRFSRSMVAAGHSKAQGEQHKDRLRYCSQQLGHRRFITLCRDAKQKQNDNKCAAVEDARARVKALPRNLVLHGHIFCSLNWFLKFLRREALTPATCNRTASQLRGTKRKRD